MIPAGAREPLPLWGVRVWEEEAPEGGEALEWILLTSLETSTLEQAWERVNYYGHRWVVEDYLKSPAWVARLSRRGDGPPGWKTLWKGWLHLQTLLEGVQLASHLRL